MHSFNIFTSLQKPNIYQSYNLPAYRAVAVKLICHEGGGGLIFNMHYSIIRSIIYGYKINLFKTQISVNIYYS